MTFDLCPHVPETWKWEQDSFYNRGANSKGKAQGNSFEPQLWGTLSLDTIAHLCPPDLFNNHQLPAP